MDATNSYATILLHHALLHALVATHPDLKALQSAFQQSMSLAIEHTEDPKLSGVLQTLEEKFREAIFPSPQ